MPRPVKLTRKLTAIIHEAEEGGYWAEVPALPGCYSQAETREEMEANIREAAGLYLEVRAEMEAEAEIPPLPKNARAVEIAV